MNPHPVLNIIHGPGLRDTALAGHAEQASRTLEEIIRGDGMPPTPPGSGVTAVWDTVLGTSGLLLKLRLTEGPDTIELVFRPSELTGDACWYSMSRAYRALLRASSRRLVDVALSHAGDGAG